MGFLDRARAAADELAARADTALAGAGLGGPTSPPAGGDAGRYLHDLGVLAYLDATGRPAAAADRERVLGALRDLEARGSIGSLALHTAPPPPGAAHGGVGGPSPAPQEQSAAAPPERPAAPYQEPPADPPPFRPASPPPEGPASPPPPPSWMKRDDAAG